MTWLIASLGTSPSVLTEALWYLEDREKGKGLSVDYMTCVGTQASWERAQEELFVPGGVMERLRSRLNKPAHWMTEGHGFSKVIANAVDNRDLEEAKATDAAFRRVIREAQEAEFHDGPVIACISGGRKTMSSSLQQAMVLLARSEDWAFHVLLDLPKGIDESTVFRSGFGFPGDPAHPDFVEVKVDAFEVPLVRLREFAATKKIDLSDEALVSKLQKAVDETRVLPHLTLELKTLKLSDEDRPNWELRLPPQQALLLAAYANAGRSVSIDDADIYLQGVLDLWRAMKLEEDSRAFPTNFEELAEAIEYWVDPRQVDRLAPQLSKLKALLIKADPSYHIFVLRAETRDGVRGFAPIVYNQARPLLRIAF